MTVPLNQLIVFCIIPLFISSLLGIPALWKFLGDDLAGRKYFRKIFESPDNLLTVDKKALELSIQAARLQPKAHILDTLAESYFINGFKDEAIATARLALQKANEKRSYYKEQLIKFQSQMI